MKKKFKKILSVVIAMLIACQAMAFAAVDIEGNDINSEVFSAYINDVKEGGNIRINYSKAVDTSTLSPDTLKLYAMDGTQIGIGFATTENKLQTIIYPQKDIDVNREYAVVFDGVKDQDGNIIKNNSCYFKMTQEKTEVSSYIYSEDFSGVAVGTALKKDHMEILADNSTDGKATIENDPATDGTNGNVLKWQANTATVNFGGYATGYTAWWDRNDYADSENAKDMVFELDTYIEAENNVCSPMISLQTRNAGQTSATTFARIFFNGTDGGAINISGVDKLYLSNFGLESAYGRWVNIKAIRRFEGDGSIDWYIDGKFIASSALSDTVNAGSNLLVIGQQSQYNTKGIAYYDNVKVGYVNETFNTYGDALTVVKAGDTAGTRVSTNLTSEQDYLVEIDFKVSELLSRAAYFTLYTTTKAEDPDLFGSKLMYAYVAANGGMGFFKDPFAGNPNANHVTNQTMLSRLEDDANKGGAKHWYVVPDAVKANETTKIKAYIDASEKTVSYYVNDSFAGKSKAPATYEGGMIPVLVGANKEGSDNTLTIEKFTITPVKQNYVQAMRITSEDEVFGFKSESIPSTLEAINLTYKENISMEGATVELKNSQGEIVNTAPVANGNVLSLPLENIVFADGTYTLTVQNINEAEDYFVSFMVDDNGALTATDLDIVTADGVTINDTTFAEGTVVYAKATIANTKASLKKVILLVAQYNGTRMVDAQFVEVPVDGNTTVNYSNNTDKTLSVTLKKDANKAKVFVWSDFNTLMPYGMNVVDSK